MTEPTLTARIFASTESVDSQVWNRLVPNTNGIPDNPFLNHAFFLALEKSGSATAQTGWQPQHIIIEKDDTPVGLMPLFLKSHSQGEYVFDHAWADAYMRAGGNYYPKLQASVPFTPATASKLLVPSGDKEIENALLSTAEQLAERLSASSVHATFVSEKEEQLAGEHEWLTRHDTQFHWYNQDYKDFDGFLDSLASRKRKNIRRERRDALASGINIKWFSGADLTDDHWDAFFNFYLDTGNRKWGQPYLTREFFTLISQSMPQNIVLMLAYEGAEPIAGALNFVGKDTIYGRNWGCIREVPFLHFELCYYQAIDYAIAHGLKIVEAGAQGQHKLARGYVPSVTRSIHWVAHQGLREAIESYLAEEKLAVLEDQTILGQFTPFRKGERQQEPEKPAYRKPISDT